MFCVEEPALIRKILVHVQPREELAGVAARAPPQERMARLEDQAEGRG